MTCGVYCIRHGSSRYVGSSVDVERRWSVHKCKLNQGLHHSQPLQRAWLKHGAKKFMFELIEECDQQLLAEREQYHIDQGARYNARRQARNMAGWKHSPETVEKMRVAAVRVGTTPEQRQVRSARAKAQWAAGKLGRRKKYQGA